MYGRKRDRKGRLWRLVRPTYVPVVDVPVNPFFDISPFLEFVCCGEYLGRDDYVLSTGEVFSVIYWLKGKEHKISFLFPAEMSEAGLKEVDNLISTHLNEWVKKVRVLAGVICSPFSQDCSHEEGVSGGSERSQKT